jgi:hypothetical protein
MKVYCKYKETQDDVLIFVVLLREIVNVLHDTEGVA